MCEESEMYEVSVQTHPRNKLHVMYQTVTSSILKSLNWCRLSEPVTSGIEFTIDYSNVWFNKLPSVCSWSWRQKDINEYIQLRMDWSRCQRQSPARTVVKKQDIIRNGLHVILRINASLMNFTFNHLSCSILTYLLIIYLIYLLLWNVFLIDLLKRYDWNIIAMTA